VASTGKAYLRGYDGDFLPPDLEEQAFLATRKPPMSDPEERPGRPGPDHYIDSGIRFTVILSQPRCGVPGAPGAGDAAFLAGQGRVTDGVTGTGAAAGIRESRNPHY
jgi:hypothetical protein